jgi:hypothetical protein
VRTDRSRLGHPPVRGALQTPIAKVSRGDLCRLGLKDKLLGGRYRNCPRHHRLRDHPQEVHLQEPVLQARPCDLDMVGELEAPFKIPFGNALVDQVAALLLTATLFVAADRFNVFSFTSIQRSSPVKPATATDML